MTFDELLLKNKQQILDSVPNRIHLSTICKDLGYSDNTRNTTKLRLFLIANNADISHFLGYVPRPKKYEDKTCPVCKKIFTININNSKELNKTTCSIGCSNTFFRSGTFAGNFRHGLSPDVYRIIAKKACEESNIPFACVVCGFSDIIDIHHADGDKENNTKDNLIPLCANHHKLWHRDMPDSIMEKIVEYQDRLAP